jgi:hypothetical protein
MRITFDWLNRRTHLYLGMVLAPWFFMYGASTVVFNHGELFRKIYGDGDFEWVPRFERDYRLAPVTEDDDEWEIAEKVLIDLGINGRYRTYVEEDGVLHIFRVKFLYTLRIRHFPDRQKLVVEQSRFRWDRFLTGMHVRGGWDWPGFLDKLWAFSVDLVVLSTIVWVLSGLYIWWKLTRYRFWGWVCLGGGLACFVLFIVGL